ncbi:putative transmembrane protein 217B [Ochotona princeps]|uniref:putative transmembrane protein 217B n=1 Tax=Ochotona princeps TaxID=9978 RepID=UPI0027148847|nr:putative transmembrane protein 217B [Ochotona princeps]
MAPEQLSRIAGLFSVLNTIQFLIFDVSQLTHIGYEDNYSIYLESDSSLASWLMKFHRNIRTGLSVVTILIGSFLVFCIRKNFYLGMPIYVVWIVVYELASFSMVLFTQGMIRKQFKQLSYLNLLLSSSRMILHFCFLPFVIKHTYLLYKDPKSTFKVSRLWHSSTSTVNWQPVGPGIVHSKSN